MQEYSWYEAITGYSTLQQGDILEDFTVYELSPDGHSSAPVLYDLMLMTQSCDINDPSLSHLVFCPIWTRAQIEAKDATFFASGKITYLAKYRMIGWYPIEKCEISGLERPWRVVQFQRIITVARESTDQYLKEAKPRLRLLTPYREHMSQHFARFFMRVGLPRELELS